MSEKEEAEELVYSFIQLNHEHAISSNEQYGMSYEYHKKCALIVVEKLLKVYTRIDIVDKIEHLQKVKKEIELL